MSNTRATTIDSEHLMQGTEVVKVIFEVIRFGLQIVAVCSTHLAFIMEPVANYALVGVRLAAVAVVLHIWEIIWDLIRIPELRPLWDKWLNRTRATFGLICGLYLLFWCTLFYLIVGGDQYKDDFAVSFYTSGNFEASCYNFGTYFYTSANLLMALYGEFNLIVNTDPAESRFDRKFGIHRSNTMDITPEGVSLVITIGLEILSAVFEQISSPSKPRFALLGLLFAIVAVLISLSELIRKGRKERVEWRWWCMLGWFYHPSPRNELFGTLLDSYGLLGGIWQCIASTVQYICYSRHVDNPIKVCLLPIIFVICLAVSKLNSRPVAGHFSINTRCKKDEGQDCDPSEEIINGQNKATCQEIK